MKIFVAGGAGFIGSNFVRYMLKKYNSVNILIYDKLTYAGRLENIKDILRNKKVRFIKADICDGHRLLNEVKEFRPDIIINFAAETHVDRSINEPAIFLKTNILGVFNILEVSRRLDISLTIHISTDEVYGDLWNKEPADENSVLRPSSPYSASKASGDLLCLAYWRTYNVPIIIIRPSNNYGPYQHPEKLIPKTIIRALYNKPIPVYGNGEQIRDWLHVEDFSRAIDTIINKGAPGEIYNVPGFNERKNIEVIKTILKILNKPLSLIKHVEDRPGHDRRYAMKGDKILSLGWKPRIPWIEGLKRTIEWYIMNKWWWRPLITDKYFVQDTPWK